MQDSWEPFKTYLAERSLPSDKLMDVIREYNAMVKVRSRVDELTAKLHTMKKESPKDVVSVEELRFENGELAHKAESLQTEIAKYKNKTVKANKRLLRMAAGDRMTQEPENPDLCVQEKMIMEVNTEIRELWTKSLVRNGNGDSRMHTKVFRAYSKTEAKLEKLRDEIANLKNCLVKN